MVHLRKLAKKVNKVSPVEFIEVTNSTMMSAYGTDGDDLLIKLISGQTYRYSAVPALVVEGLGAAASKGKYFTTSIKPIYSARLV